ncbi:hypothetical protein MIDIC_490031 [Alphaproteobacteria bacterium]
MVNFLLIILGVMQKYNAVRSIPNDTSFVDKRFFDIQISDIVTRISNAFYGFI